MRFLVRHARLWLPMAILAAALAVSFQEPVFLTGLRDSVFDGYQRLKPRVYQPSPVRIIDIDEESLARIGQWPWPRTKISALVERLRDQGAAVIALDMVFAEPDRTSPSRVIPLWDDVPELQQWAHKLQDHDDILAATVAGGGVVTGFALSNKPGQYSPAVKAGFAMAGEDPMPFIPRYSGAVTTLTAVEAHAAGNGALNVTKDHDGIIRRVPMVVRLDDKIYPSMAAEALRVAQGAGSYVIKSAGASGEQSLGTQTGMTAVRVGAFEGPTDEQGQMWVYFTKPASERFIPAWQVLEGELEQEDVEGVIYLLGSSATGLQDLHATPLRMSMPGVTIHAQIIEQLIHGEHLSRPDWANGAERLLMVLLSILVVVLGYRIGPLWSAFIGGTATVGALAISWYAFSQHQLLFDPVFPALTVLAVYLVFSLVRHFQSEREHRWVRGAFSSYVSPDLVEQLVENPSHLKLSGERRELTFVFTDLEGFTALVERSEPTVIVPLLNNYLDGMSRIAFEHDGTIDKIVGDAIHLIFGAPLAQPDHAARAVACALKMDAFATAYAAQVRTEGIPLGETRIGVNTGPTIIGNFGGERRFDYTAHGDAINTAARLESVNKYLGTRVCVSGHTAELCPEFHGRPAGSLILKGKTRGIDVFEPLPAAVMESERVVAYLDAFERMKHNDPTAADAFAALLHRYPEDRLAAFHLKRLRNHEKGVRVVMTEK